jgi:protease I
MSTALLLIAPIGYQDVELKGTRDGLVAAGFEVEIGSTEVGACTGKFGGAEQATVAFRDVDVSRYDRLAFIGGPGAGELWKNEDAKRIARDAASNGMAYGAICIAPKILAEAGVLKGKKATVWNDDGAQESFLRERGADYTGEQVTIDGRLITGNGPEAAVEFGKTLAKLR